jgi:hypothetical protein
VNVPSNGKCPSVFQILLKDATFRELQLHHKDIICFWHLTKRQKIFPEDPQSMHSLMTVEYYGQVTVCFHKDPVIEYI